MKYGNFKIFKFSTISKRIDHIRDSFSIIHKNIKNILGFVADIFSNIIKYIFSEINQSIKLVLRGSFSIIRKNIKTISKYVADFFSYIVKYIFSKINQSFKFIIHVFSKIYKLIDLRRLNFKRVYKYLDIRRYVFYDITKKINLAHYKYLPIYFVVFVIFLGFVYVVIPIFYSYDKSKIENTLCNNQNIECLIRGKVNYSFYPTPRIKIKDLIINDVSEKKNTLATVEDATIKLSIKNLLVKAKHKFKRVKLKNFEINVNLKNLEKYKNIIKKEIDFIPTTFTKGQIIFFNGKDYVATINDTKLNLILEEDSKEAVLKGKFLNDSIYISLSSKKIDDKPSTDIILKMSDLNLLTKANFFNSEKNKDAINGNILIKKDKNRFTGIFSYKDNEITINKSNLRNVFLDGKLEGKIKILPYFNFNLDLILNSINFTKLYNYFLTLDEKKQKNIFRINEKINGKLSLSSDKIYSSYNLVQSFESRIKFNNGNILVEQFLINLGKLGAADILGSINKEEKFTNFKYESNIFMDNQKKFLSKFGIYDKKSISSNLFISGNFDLQNIRNSFYEISNNEKFNNEDVNFIEQEFNDFMLIDGYKNLFRFPKFKEFVKSIISEIN